MRCLSLNRLFSCSLSHTHIRPHRCSQLRLSCIFSRRRHLRRLFPSFLPHLHSERASSPRQSTFLSVTHPPGGREPPNDAATVRMSLCAPGDASHSRPGLLKRSFTVFAPSGRNNGPRKLVCIQRHPFRLWSHAAAAAFCVPSPRLLHGILFHAFEIAPSS